MKDGFNDTGHPCRRCGKVFPFASQQNLHEVLLIKDKEIAKLKEEVEACEKAMIIFDNARDSLQAELAQRNELIAEMVGVIERICIIVTGKDDIDELCFKDGWNVIKKAKSLTKNGG